MNPEVRPGQLLTRERSSDSPPPTLPRRRNLDQRRLFVGNLSYFTTKEDVQELFGPFGTIYGIQICKSRNNDPLYYGFVHFTTIPAANAAIEALHGKLFMGRRIKVHHDDVDDTSMTYGTRHMDKKTHPKGDESNAAVPAASSQDPHEDAAAVAAPAAAPQPTTSEPPKEKRGIQVLISFSSEQAETLIREDVLHRLFARFGAVLDCVVKGHSSSPNYHPYHHSGGHHGDAGPRDAAPAAQSGYGFVIFEHEEDAQRCLEHFQSPAAAEAAAANGDATQTTDAPTVTPTVRLTDELTGLSVACELRIAKPRAPVHGHAAHRHGRRGPSGFGSGNVSRSTSTSPRAQRPTSGNLTGHLHGLVPDAAGGAGGAHLYVSNAAVYNTPPHGGSAVPLYGQPQQLLMMQGFMQYTGSEFYSPSPSVSRTQSVQSNYSSRSTSPRLSLSNGPNGSSVGTPQQAAYGGAGSPRTGSPRLSGMMHTGNVVYHTPQHAPGPASGGGSGGVYMMTPPSGYVQSISSELVAVDVATARAVQRRRRGGWGAGRRRLRQPRALLLRGRLPAVAGHGAAARLRRRAERAAVAAAVLVAARVAAYAAARRRVARGGPQRRAAVDPRGEHPRGAAGQRVARAPAPPPAAAAGAALRPVARPRRLRLRASGLRVVRRRAAGAAVSAAGPLRLRRRRRSERQRGGRRVLRADDSAAAAAAADADADVGADAPAAAALDERRSAADAAAARALRRRRRRRLRAAVVWRLLRRGAPPVASVASVAPVVAALQPRPPGPIAAPLCSALCSPRSPAAR